MLKSIMVRVFVYGVAGVFLTLTSTPISSAQTSALSAPHDFMVDNTPLNAEELRSTFNNRTHLGYYRFERDTLSTTRFMETTASDGRVTHVQGDETLTGTWHIKSNQMCYQYDDVWPNIYCFDIYKVGTCYYHYIRTQNETPVNRWTARSTPKGEVPNCDVPTV